MLYIAYLISVALYKCLKRILLHFENEPIALPAPTNERKEGHLVPSASLFGVPKHVPPVPRVIHPCPG